MLDQLLNIYQIAYNFTFIPAECFWSSNIIFRSGYGVLGLFPQCHVVECSVSSSCFFQKIVSSFVQIRTIPGHSRSAMSCSFPTICNWHRNTGSRSQSRSSLWYSLDTPLYILLEVSMARECQALVTKQCVGITFENTYNHYRSLNWTFIYSFYQCVVYGEMVSIA